MVKKTYSLVIPIYGNEGTIPRLLQVLELMNVDLDWQLEVVFVIDGSPDNSLQLLREKLYALPYAAQLLVHSRNFGSFAAIRTGLAAAKGDYFGVMAADLQEPYELIVKFFMALNNGEADVTIGVRNSRSDAFLTKVSSEIFWWFYRRLIIKDMPKGGVDVFACNRKFRDQLLFLEESRSSLIALIFWLGYKRKFISYDRLTRIEGKSGWTLSKKIDYMMDSIFAFTDYPIRLLMKVGAIGVATSLLMAAVVVFARLSGSIQVPGYAALILSIVFFGALNLFGLGLVGTYAWRGYENTKKRPLAITAMKYENNKD